MERKETKSIVELKVNQRVINQNINRLYNICSALFQEIQEIKHFVNFKHSDQPDVGNNLSSSTNNLQNNSQNNSQNSDTLQNSMNVLENLGDFADSLPNNNNGTRKLKIINN